MPTSIYLDYNATTPLDAAVREAMLPFLEELWGNPSSIHHVGRRVRSILDAFREQAAARLGCKSSEVVFTSGGTESNNLAIMGVVRQLKAKGRHLITSAVEHHAVLHCFQYLAKHEGFDLTLLPVDSEGRVSVESLRAALRPDTLLVSVMAANNEVGTLQPVSELGAVCRDRGVLFHTDAAQWFGKVPFAGIQHFNADLVSLCAHKFHGPKGAGLLYVRSPILPHPIMLGGGHENDRRAGTENMAAIAGLVTAMDLFLETPVFSPSLLDPMTARLSSTLSSIPGITLLVQKAPRLVNTLSFVTENADSIALLAALDIEGICASAGAACSAGSLEPSHVVSAMGFNPALARSLVRFSLGRLTSPAEIDTVCALLPGLIRRSQGLR